jgi:peptide/nickel transport system substrate-binding protein
LVPLLARTAAILVAALAAASGVSAEPRPAISMHGSPALPPDFKSLPYVNPDAPKGGRVVYAVQGSFDSVNPFIVNGAPAAGINTLVFDTLMRRSADEPFTFYPLLASSIDTPDDRSYVEFKLNPEAKFSDGRPVTAADVAFSWDLLKTRGRPNTRQSYAKVAKIDIKDGHTIRFDLSGANDRELPLILATMVVLPKHAIDPETFERSTLKPLIGSGPYEISDVQPGRSITMRRNASWWGKDLPSNRGLYNFDEVRYDYYRDANAMFEAFKTGLYDVRPETDATRWATQYDFPALREGRVLKEDVSNSVPKGMNAFVFNTRRPVFKDKRVREALAALFDFEWANRNLYFGLYARTCSFFEGSELSACGRAADEKERALLKPFPDAVSPDVLEGRWEPQRSDGSGRDRTVARRVSALLKEAGYEVKDGSMRHVESGSPLAFEILAVNKEQERLGLNYADLARRLGIKVGVRLVDDVQYRRRQQTFDFDVIQFRWLASLSPGNEQNFRWSSKAADSQGSFNFAGVKSPAVDAMIGALLAATSREDFVAATRALDRILISGHYVIPLFNAPNDWLARWKGIERPARAALTGAPLEAFWQVPQ